MDKLILHQAGFLAQKRLARGILLNCPEAIALISTQILERIRDGKSVAELMDWGKKLLGRADVMEGVPEMISEVQVEGTFPDGSKLVTIHHPIVREFGDIELALYGSFLPIPLRKGQLMGEAYVRSELVPGEFITKPGEILINEGRETVTLIVSNRGDRPIQVGSHYLFTEANRALSFDRNRAYGMRLNIPAGTAVRFEPGETKTVSLVAIGGNKVLRGGNGLSDGPVSDMNRTKTLLSASERGFQ